ncbi:MAG TPA: hypothetical protein VFI47_03690, partial [Acidimicrobiales bacterium]|nr:hypothetical protein [Acidimicrobiales bacterium]
MTALVERMIDDLGVDVDVACCPEPIAEGHAMTELLSLPTSRGAGSPPGPAASRNRRAGSRSPAGTRSP